MTLPDLGCGRQGRPLDRTTKTVSELIALLQVMPPDAPVWSEGCDCWGDCTGVELQDEGGVLILRGTP